MTGSNPDNKSLTRRSFLTLTGGALAMGSALLGGKAVASPEPQHQPTDVEPFWGAHQGGITTPSQKQTYFAAFDLVTTKRADVIHLLQSWTEAAARMTRGLACEPAGYSSSESFEDSDEALGLSPQRLTITFGFGPGLFESSGVDRYGLKAHRPDAFVDLPDFNGDQLVPAQSGGDLSVQACADDPQVAFHAVRELERMSYGVTQIRWAQTGFLPNSAPNETPRNLMGFKDGTVNPSAKNPHDMNEVVWVGSEGPRWMQGGSYLVSRKIRMALEHWDRTPVSFQEQTFGRHKMSGAPIGCPHEFSALDLNAMDKDGNPLIAQNAHVRLAAPSQNNGAQIFRRPFSFNDGLVFTTERWPPWRQGMEYDAGLLFLAYQKDIRASFIPIYQKMSEFDMLNQFTTHVASAIFACPPGAEHGHYIGQALFEQV